MAAQLLTEMCGFLCYQFMAKYRYINTKFWSDNFIVNLDPLDRYIFLYLLTNEHTNISGIYELPLKVMAAETGLEPEMLKVILSRLEQKIDYYEGWVILKNFLKHQNTKSATTLKGIVENLKVLPQNLMGHIRGMDTPCIPHHILILIPILKSILKKSVATQHIYKKKMKTYDENKYKDELPSINLETGKLEEEPKKVNQNEQWYKFRAFWEAVVLKDRGFKPETNLKDKVAYHAIAKKFTIPQIEQLVFFFLQDKKSKEHLTVTACLSADTINNWKQK